MTMMLKLVLVLVLVSLDVTSAALGLSWSQSNTGSSGLTGGMMMMKPSPSKTPKPIAPPPSKPVAAPSSETATDDDAPVVAPVKETPSAPTGESSSTPAPSRTPIMMPTIVAAPTVTEMPSAVEMPTVQEPSSPIGGATPSPAGLPMPSTETAPSTVTGTASPTKPPAAAETPTTVTIPTAVGPTTASAPASGTVTVVFPSFEITVEDGSSTSADKLAAELQKYLSDGISAVYDNVSFVLVVGEVAPGGGGRRHLQSTTTYRFEGAVGFTGDAPPQSDVDALLQSLLDDFEALQAALSATIVSVNTNPTDVSTIKEPDGSSQGARYNGALIGGVTAAATVGLLAVLFLVGRRRRRTRSTEDFEDAQDQEDDGEQEDLKSTNSGGVRRMGVPFVE